MPNKDIVISLLPVNRAERKAILLQRKQEREGTKGSYVIKVPMANVTIEMKGPQPINTGATPDPVDPTISTIPNINLSQGFTRDMSQYWTDPDNRVTTSQILGLNTDIATYSHPILTGTELGTSNSLQLEITYV